ncbi:hypothetical protein CYPRO_2919 [Cyclonatronum proteinivorum]|uniref:Uncharacterized protein n=1 Tax=Cyclonatronum proteinivorum TaxID=1457365 RepID=A0A345UNV5_9BACT|nr:hypothetical protein [Cyclonatronum proteinivorum]AXJ02157.1 hypothetical protein CYPRO_2919 [Cyclonatronum proteinivorum]
MKHIIHIQLITFITILFISIGCNTTSSESNNPDEVFGYWKLDRIVYETGEVLRPGDGEIEVPDIVEFYWLGFRDIDVEAEGDNRKQLSGGAYCNWAGGWFTEKPGRELDVTLICSRAVCGIATEFCSAVTTSYSYEFRRGNLLLSFEHPRQQGTISGQVILSTFNPTNGD